MGNTVCARYESEGVVWSPKLKKNVFTTAAVDNIDHNPSSSFAKDAFHGTGISLFQHPSADATGEERDVPNLDNTNKKHLAQLPASYDNVPSLILPKTEPPVLPLLGPFVSNCMEMPSAVVTEFKWLDNVRDRLNHEISKDTFRGILRICSCQLCWGKSWWFWRCSCSCGSVWECFGRRFCREDLIWESVGTDERKEALPLYGGLNHVMFHWRFLHGCGVSWCLILQIACTQWLPLKFTLSFEGWNPFLHFINSMEKRI